MILLGLSGKAKSGKDTAAIILARLLGIHHYQRLAFADPLKKEVAKACGIDEIFIEENKNEFRPMLQWWGTEFRRRLKGGDDYWLKAWIKAAMLCDKALLVVPDVRFVNEAETIKGCGGILIRINRSGLPNDEHESETALDSYSKFDFVVRNDGPLQELELTLQEVAQQIKKREHDKHTRTASNIHT